MNDKNLKLKFRNKIYTLQSVSAWEWTKKKREFFKIQSDGEIKIISEKLLEYFFEHVLFPETDSEQLSLKTVSRLDSTEWEGIANQFLTKEFIPLKYRIEGEDYPTDETDFDDVKKN